MFLSIRNTFIFLLLAATMAPSAFGHAELGYNLRAGHFEYTKTGMTAYMRFSLALLVANQLGAKNPDGTYIPAPYTYNVDVALLYPPIAATDVFQLKSSLVPANSANLPPRIFFGIIAATISKHLTPSRV